MKWYENDLAIIIIIFCYLYSLLLLQILIYDIDLVVSSSINR